MCSGHRGARRREPRLRGRRVGQCADAVRVGVAGAVGRNRRCADHELLREQILRATHRRRRIPGDRDAGVARRPAQPFEPQRVVAFALAGEQRIEHQ